MGSADAPTQPLMRAAGYLVVTKSGDWFFGKPGSPSKSLGLGS